MLIILIKLSPFAYSQGIVNVVFEDCIITDLKDDGFELIYAYSKPMEGSSIIFRNCTIDKPTGNLIGGYNNGIDWKLNLIFENTLLSDNLQLNDTQKQYVNLIIK
mgnify:FL=1